MKKKILVIMMLFCSLVILFFFLFCPNIKLDKEVTTIEVHTQYDKTKYKAENLLLDVTNRVNITSNVNTHVIGKYYTKFNIKYLFFYVEKQEQVIVVDREKPTIVLNGLEEVMVCPNKEYQEEGYIVTDNYDKDLTDKLKIKQDKDIIYYEVTDSSGNKSKIERKIVYGDSENPKIELKGSSNVNIYFGNEYEEEGYIVNDNCDGDLSSKVTIDNKVNTNKVGTYEITYTVQDSFNNTSSVTRKVDVINRPIIPTTSIGDGVIYLTFDDGPSSTITSQILDILKEEGVKATFFVIEKPSRLDYLIKRAYNEGHTIALHSSTHSYSYIYSSINNYFNDLNSIKNKVFSLTGINSRIIRFPGGSSNTVSRNYCYGIMSDLVNQVTEKGYIYFDWNVDSKDAGGATNSNQVYYNVINNLSYYKTNIVLMHDFENNYKTLYALRDIIKYGKANGYTFSNITELIPRVVHGVNN